MHRDHAAASRRNLSRGILLMVLAMLLLPGIDAIAKGLLATLPAGEITWSRFFFQCLYLLPFVMGTGAFKAGRRLWIDGARGVLIACATLLFFASLVDLPLADAISIFFVEPLILTLLSATLLGERVGWRRALAVIIGFCGSLIVIRPSYEVFGLTALLPAGAALLFAFYMVLTRLQARGGNAVSMQFTAGLSGLITMTAALWFGRETGLPVLDPLWPTLREWLLMAALGAIATTGHVLIVLAVRRIGAAVVAPFQYLEIIGATILGLLLFGDFPDATTWLGVTVIIGSGLFVFYRERKLAGREDVDG